MAEDKNKPKKLPWLRLYARIIDDEEIRLLAFEDRWHFVALLCMKRDGILDEPNASLRKRKMAVKMGLDTAALDEVLRRLFEVNLTDKHGNPKSWDDLQFESDSSTERVRKYREKKKKSEAKRACNVSVTGQDTDTDTDTDTDLKTTLPEEELYTGSVDEKTGEILVAWK